MDMKFCLSAALLGSTVSTHPAYAATMTAVGDMATRPSMIYGWAVLLGVSTVALAALCRRQLIPVKHRKR
jgi:hypothetical protein